jgi:site-specific recombinase XerD
MKYKDEDIANWPNTWAGISEDIEFGNKIIQIFKPFIKYLKEKQLSRKTINLYIDDLWILGGFIIKQLHSEEKYRKYKPQWLFPYYIDSWDGPHISDLTEYEQNQFDRTCRRFYKFLVKNYLRKELKEVD